MNNLANLLSDQGKLSEAEPLYRDVLRCRRETLGETHPRTLSSMNNLANLLSDQGKLSEAEPLYRDALRYGRETLGETHPDTLSAPQPRPAP
jgi:tetratricopeptide (TPR) repeat protein